MSDKNIKHLLFLSILCSLVLFINCGDTTVTVDSASEAILTINASPPEGGLVFPQAGTYDVGTTVELTATANTNYTFIGWTGDFEGSSNPVTLTMLLDQAVTANFELLDTDEDGLTDDIDACQNSPQGETANDVGCSPSQTDTDGDSITDDLDTCPETAEDVTVDQNGCADSQKDTDGDGFTDDLDTCPNTPDSATVDENGCADSQKDTDGDGVTDDLDTCEDTAEDDTVDENGCANSQKDTDGDGVTNDLDTCADTPEGATVDENGCADSQKDTDGDGVTDDLDTCPETAEDVTVDQNGCADSQKDTDGDGVTDDLDKCPDTAENATFDENGCANSQTFLGDTYQGGIVFYIFQEGDNGYVDGEVHGLIAANGNQTTDNGAYWGCNSTEISGADGTAIGTGAQNTLDILAGCNEDGIAAKLAADYEVTVDGVTYDDWFLPSKDELNVLYLNKDFVGSFEVQGEYDILYSDNYWSSTETDYSLAGTWSFSFGNYNDEAGKPNPYMVRSVRAF